MFRTKRSHLSQHAISEVYCVLKRWFAKIAIYPNCHAISEVNCVLSVYCQPIEGGKNPGA